MNLEKDFEEIIHLKEQADILSDKYLVALVDYLKNNASSPEIQVSILIGQCTGIVTGLFMNVISQLLNGNIELVASSLLQMSEMNIALVDAHFGIDSNEVKH